MILKVKRKALGIIFLLSLDQFLMELKKWKESNNYGKSRKESNWREKSNKGN